MDELMNKYFTELEFMITLRINISLSMQRVVYVFQQFILIYISMSLQLNKKIKKDPKYAL